MPIDPEEFAQMLGAEIAGEVPEVGGGPFGMARLAHIMHERLTPSQGERPGRPTNPNWVTRCKVPMSEATLQKLAQLAEKMSTPERKVSPMQVAAQMLEEAVACVRARTKVAANETVHDLQEVPTSKSELRGSEHDLTDEATSGRKDKLGRKGGKFGSRRRKS